MKRICLIISILWIGLGTFMMCMPAPYRYLGMDSGSAIYNCLLMMELPSNFVLFVSLFSAHWDEMGIYDFIFIALIQAGNVLLHWFILYQFCRLFKKIRNKFFWGEE